MWLRVLLEVQGSIRLVGVDRPIALVCGEGVCVVWVDRVGPYRHVASRGCGRQISHECRAIVEGCEGCWRCLGALGVVM